MKILDIGTKESFSKELNNEIRTVNLIASIVGSIIAIPFVVISLIFAPSLAIYPGAGIVVCAGSIGLNAIGAIGVSKFIISILPTYLAFFYHIGAVHKGESLIQSLIIIQSSFTLIPFLVISLKDKFFLLTSVFIVFLSVFFLQESIPLLEMDVDASFLREGWFSKIILLICILIGSAIIFAFSLINSNAKEEANKTLSENKLKSDEIKESEKVLQEKVSELVAYQEKEKDRNWAAEGIAKFAAILRTNNDDLHVLSDDIINNLIKYLGANQGSIFVINDDKKNPKMKLEATYAFDRKKYHQKEIELGEGLVGQCWQEKEKIYLTDIPQNYINITSGLGLANPTSIIIIPLLVNDDIYGIIEIASFHTFETHQIEFLERLVNSIASTLSSVKVNLRTSSLLEEAQQMSEEMQAQEEELRQNAEEMQATQEEMERTNIDLKKKNELMLINETEMKANLEEAQEMSEEMVAQEEMLRLTSEEIQNVQEEMELAQEELTKKEASLRTIIDNSEDSIFAINTKYEITVINTRLLNKYKDSGMDLSEGKNILDLLPEDKKQFWKARYDRALAGEKFEIKEESIPGEYLLVSHYPTFNEKNEITGVAVISREIKKQ